MAKTKFPLFDTGAIIQYRREIQSSKNLISKMRLSMVVFYELTATTIDQSHLKLYENWRILFNQQGLLFTPTMLDWNETAKLIRRLRFGQKTASHGKTPKLNHAHELQNDALIARTSRLHDCYIVTTDVDDFSHFLPFMKKLEIVSADDFFN